MKIDDFIKCFNTSIQIARKTKGIVDNGHFIFYQYYKKKLGNYYHYTMKIEYVANIDNSKNVQVLPFNLLNQIIQIPTEALDREIRRTEIVEQLQQTILTSFLTKVMNKDLYESIIDGTYGTK